MNLGRRIQSLKIIHGPVIVKRRIRMIHGVEMKLPRYPLAQVVHLSGTTMTRGTNLTGPCKMHCPLLRSLIGATQAPARSPSNLRSRGGITTMPVARPLLGATYQRPKMQLGERVQAILSWLHGSQTIKLTVKVAVIKLQNITHGT